jgi:putative hydrolase of the HAD superfamily
VSALLFDLDNTLFDRDRAFMSWAQAFVQTRLAPQDDLRRREALSLLLSLDGHGYGSRPAMFATLKKTYPALSESVDSLVEAYYRQLRDYVSLDEGARRLLDTLDRSGVPFGIVTNGSYRQMHKIEALGLDTRATCIFVSEVFGCRKPQAAIFLAAAACLNARPAEILFVGDDPEADYGAHIAPA